MQEKPKIVVARTRRSEAPAKTFVFTAAMVPASGVLADYRQKAWQIFNSLSLPSMAEEAWRRTDLRELPADTVHLPTDGAFRDLAPVPADLLKPLTADKHGGQVVLLPGGAKPYLSPGLINKGVIFTDLHTAERENPELVARMTGQTVSPEEGKFAALAGALSQNGVVLYIPKGVTVEQPLNSLLWGPGVDLAYLSHILVWVDEGASVTYVHEAASPDENGPALHAGIVEIKVSDNASLRFVELQSWGRHIWNFSHERVSVGRDGNLDWIFGAIGSRLTKNFSELNLVGEGATGRMSGFYFTDGYQHLDHDTQQNHLAPHTTSDLLFKGALKGHSRSVWQGMIYVAVGAAKTDGYQANRNLVLSPNARADSIPGLEILADDVRCSHGATVGKLEQEPLFYLKSRGIPEKEAERLLVEGFFDPIMQRIPYEGVRARFQQAIHEKTATQ
ncbi:MAG: Fe-S cluster assembly protein SufD [Candidatus Atribacteria bacterium]|nr:Fe-S cluster assembly protein SufD [Candidatus Atribacteria bacterium]